MGDVIIKAEDLWFSYDGEEAHALRGLSLELRKGRKIALMGANGAGSPRFSCAATEFINRRKGLYIMTEIRYPMIRKDCWN